MSNSIGRSQCQAVGEPASWTVVATVTRTVALTCDGCTRQQAEDADAVMNFVTDECCLETTDWEIISVEPNQ